MTSSSLAATKYVWVDDTLNFTRGQYNFTIKTTASGGGVHYIDFTLNVVYDCNFDNITVAYSIPSTASTSRAVDMIMVGDHPVTIISGVVGTLTSYDLDLKTLISNNASAYCPIEEYKIAKVYNYTSGAVESTASFSTRMSLDTITGIWEFTDLSKEYMNIYVTFMAYNGVIWSSVNAQ